MSIHTRQLPTNSGKLLDTLVDPNARHEDSSSRGASPAPVPREKISPPDDTPWPRSTVHSDPGPGGATDRPWYRRETWLAVQITAIVPILGAMFVPASYRLPLCILGGVLVAIGTVMLLRHKPTTASSSFGNAEPG